MTSQATYVVIGAGQAGGRAVEAMRAAGFAGRIVLIGEEAYPPYERPPLSKKLLTGGVEPQSAYVNPLEFYAEHGIELLAGTAAQAVDAKAGRVMLSDGASVDFDKCLFTTGGRVRTLAVPGATLAGIFYVRTIDDSLKLRAALGTARRLVVVGGGYLGLEAAASARTLGVEVTVVECQNSLLERVAAPEIGRVVEALHVRQGTRVMTGVEVTAIEGDGKVTGVRLGDGTVLAADAVAVSIGIIPNTELAQGAGCAIDNGIVVDEFGATTVPGLYAAGDVANHPNPYLGRRVRLESWQNAQNQAIAAAKAMCGAGVPHAEVPWFWSDQYDVNIQLAGVPDRWDAVVFRGEPGSEGCCAFYLTDGRITGVTGFNAAADVRFGRKLIEAGAAVAAADLANPDRKLRDLLRAVQAAAPSGAARSAAAG